MGEHQRTHYLPSSAGRWEVGQCSCVVLLNWQILFGRVNELKPFVKVLSLPLYCIWLDGRSKELGNS